MRGHTGARSSAARLVIASIAVGALVVAGCGNDNSTDGGGGSRGGTSQAPYKIGAILTLSGPAAQIGQHERDGAQSAAKEINAAGGVHGRKVELVVSDDEGNPNSAVSAFNGLARQDDIIGLFGATYGSATLAFKPLLDREQIPVIAPNSTYEVTHPVNKWLFRDIISSDVEVKASEGAFTEAGIKSIAILHTTDAYGQQGAELFTRGRFTVTGVEEMEVDASDVTTQLTKLRGGNPDALVLWGSTPNVGIALKNVGQLGLGIPIVTGTAGPTPGNLKAAAGSSALKHWLTVGVLDPKQPLPRQAKAVAKLEADHPEYRADVHSAIGYDAIQMHAEALKQAGPDVDRASLRDAIEKIAGFEGVAGVFSYTPDNHDGASLDSVGWLGVDEDGYHRVDDPVSVLTG